MVSTGVIHRLMSSKQIYGNIHKALEQVFFIHQPIHHITIINDHIRLFKTGIVQQFRNIIRITMNIIQHNK